MSFLILLTLLVTFMLSVANVTLAVRNNRLLLETKKEVTTSNGSSVAQLVDAQETRRVESIPPADRTVAEFVHMVVVPPVLDPPILPKTG